MVSQEDTLSLPITGKLWRGVANGATLRHGDRGIGDSGARTTL